MSLEGSMKGGCIECGRAIDLATAHKSPRKRFGVTVDWLYEAECVDPECDVKTRIMKSLDHARWPHRAYKRCAIKGCVFDGIYPICQEDLSSLPDRLRADVVVGVYGAVARAVELRPERFFLNPNRHKED